MLGSGQVGYARSEMKEMYPLTGEATTKIICPGKFRLCPIIPYIGTMIFEHTYWHTFRMYVCIHKHTYPYLDIPAVQQTIITKYLVDTSHALIAAPNSTGVVVERYGCYLLRFYDDTWRVTE